jgi:ATP phosphoribosyltransferase regulatory subunit
VAPRALAAAIRAPWGGDAGLREAIAALRAQGQTVVCALPGHDHQVDEFHCDRELVPDTARAGAWTVRNL